MDRPSAQRLAAVISAALQRRIPSADEKWVSGVSGHVLAELVREGVEMRDETTGLIWNERNPAK